VVIDEIQRVPKLLIAIKASVDRDRTPGRFLLTGSSNVLLHPGLSDSLAGRMSVVRLHPFSQSELSGTGDRFLTELLKGSSKTPASNRDEDLELVERMARGGYPAAIGRKGGARRSAWYRDYVDAIVARDVRSLTKIAGLDVLPKLLSAIAANTASLLNVSELSGPFELSRPTLRGYLTVLRNVFLYDEVAAWNDNRLSRLVKSPKIHIGDCGLGAAILGISGEELAEDRKLFGRLVETFVFHEIQRQAGFSDDPIVLSHYRDKDGVEVDIVVEKGLRHVVGIEVKAGSTVTSSDFRGLRRLREVTGDRFRSGVVLYDGEQRVAFGEDLFAVPMSEMWRKPARNPRT
jgi:predicted AAA+ superfamily ATPase